MHSSGQTRTHLPQPKQKVLLTFAYFPSARRMQWRGHSRMQAPQPMQASGSAQAYSRESSPIARPSQNFAAIFASGVRPTVIAPFGQNS